MQLFHVYNVNGANTRDVSHCVASVHGFMLPFIPLMIKGLVAELIMHVLHALYNCCKLLFYTDLTFIHEGNSTKTGNMVNLEKMAID